jgi:hypothetical protein
LESSRFDTKGKEMFSLTFKKTTLLLGIVMMLASSAAFAQEDKSTRVGGTNQSVTGTASVDRVRIAAPSAVVQLRLEVYDEAGKKLLDTEQRGGNVLDWHLQGGTGERVADGTYLCVVTIKSLSGRLTQKLGRVIVSGQSTSLSPASAADLNLQQAQAVGPVESGEVGLAVMAGDVQPVTVVANSGAEGQLSRTRGALSFRVGDFFSGNDTEQMRLTEEGNLGIGVSKPGAKLDVGGSIRAREGFLFSDGSKLNVNDQGGLTLTSAAGNIVPNVSGTGTQGRLARWLDNAGTLGNSIVADNDIGLQLVVPPTTSADTNLLYLNSTNGTIGMLAGVTPSYGAANGPFFAMRGNTYTTVANQRGLFTIGAGNVANPVGDEGSVKFNTGNNSLRMVIRPSGNVGIGTSNPTSLLDVGGDLKVSGNAVVAGNIAAKYQDVAEWVASRRQLAPATLVVLDTSVANTVRASTRAYDTHVAGVVSSQPGITLGDRGTGKILVATTGRVKIKVDATSRPIKIGDLLVTSNIPGVAMKSEPFRFGRAQLHRPGTIVGKALEPLLKGRGEILLLLSLQ